MNVSDYVQDSEKTLVTTAVERIKPSSVAGEGQLVCTDSRVAFIQDGNALAPDRVTDISRESITAVDYTGPTLLNAYIGIGMGLLALAAFAFLIASPLGIPEILALIPALLGFGLLLVGVLRRHASVRFRTSAQTYEFTGSDTSSLEKVPHAVRY